MADFITRLAARTLGLMPLVQPMIASMYAQGPSQNGNSIADLEREAIQEREAGAPPSAHQVKQSRPEHTQSGTVPPDPIEYGSSQTPLQRENPVLSPAPLPETKLSLAGKEDVISSTPSPILAERATSTFPQAITQPDREIAKDGVAAHERDKANTLIEDRRTSDSPAAHPTIAPTQRPDRGEEISVAWPDTNAPLATQFASPPAAKSSAQPTILPDVKPPAQGIQSVDQIHIHTQELQRGWEMENQRMSKTEEGSVTPVIQVTIGRIEVRATPASTPRSRSQAQHSGPPSSPVMSLDEYLNLRAKGGR